jgi:beta-lactamase class A
MFTPSKSRPTPLTLPATVVACLLSLALTVRAEQPTLEGRLRPLIDAHKGQTAVAVKHLPSGVQYEWNADRPMPTASLIKVPVMIEAYRQSDAGRLDLTRRIALQKEDKVPGSGVLTDHFSPGAEFSLRDAIRLMIVFSDNTATNLVLDRIGLGATAASMDTLGFPNTKIHSKVYRRETSMFPERSKEFGLGSTTAHEMLTVFEKLHRGELASPESAAAMFNHLYASESKTLNRFLPDGTKLAQKTGSVNASRTAAGLIDSPSGPIVVVVLTTANEDQRWTEENAGEVLCGRIAREAFDHFTSPAPSGDATPPPK